MIERVKNDIEEILLTELAEGEEMPSDLAIEKCFELAHAAEPYITSALSTKCAVFPNDTGGLDFVIQSMRTDRRLTFKIFKTGEVVVMTIDENMTSSTQSVTTPEEIIKQAKWAMKVE